MLLELTTCRVCHEDLTDDHFTDDSTICRTCNSERGYDYEEKGYAVVDGGVAYDKREMHPIVRTELELTQNNCCAICGKSEYEERKRLALDHNHETGVIRGLLCGRCNRLIGFAEDSPDILQSAINYLKKH